MMDWVLEGKSYTRVTSSGQVHIIEERPDGWEFRSHDPDRLSVRKHVFYWHETELADLFDVAKLVDALEIKRAEFEDAPKTFEIVPLSDQVNAGVTWHGRYFDVCLRDLEGVEIGRYYGGLNSQLSDFVYGEVTITGSQEIDEGPHRGKGYASKAVDAAEKVMGLRAVPHGRMFAPGHLSDLAAESWRKRNLRTPVLGMNDEPEILDRYRRMLDTNARHTARFSLDRYDVGLRLAKALGYGLTLVTVDADRGNRPYFDESTSREGYSYAFATREDGSVVSMAGENGIAEAVEWNLRLEGLSGDDEKHPPTYSTVTVAFEEVVERHAARRQTGVFWAPDTVDREPLERVARRELALPPSSPVVHAGVTIDHVRAF